jgi:hypothetical protein
MLPLRTIEPKHYVLARSFGTRSCPSVSRPGILPVQHVSQFLELPPGALDKDFLPWPPGLWGSGAEPKLLLAFDRCTCCQPQSSYAADLLAHRPGQAIGLVAGIDTTGDLQGF